MNKIEENEFYIRYEDEIQVRTEFKNGGSITSLKHPQEWHLNFEKDDVRRLSPCYLCSNQPERLKRSGCESISDSPI